VPNDPAVPKRVRQPLTAPPVLNHTWALDFMTETLYDGRRTRLLTIIDERNREGLEIAMGVSLPSRRVVRVLNELVAVHGRPAAVRVANRPEFTAQPLVDWCAEHRVACHLFQKDMTMLIGRSVVEVEPAVQFASQDVFTYRWVEASRGSVRVQRL
jgi:putative transposase